MSVALPVDIKNAEHLNDHQLAQAIAQGGRVVEFSWCVSVLVMSFRRTSRVFIAPGEGTFGAHLPYTMLSLAAGWWGFPWGLIFTPITLIHNLSGGTDVTAQYAHALPAPAAPQGFAQQTYGQQQFGPQFGQQQFGMHPPAQSAPPASAPSQGQRVTVQWSDGSHYPATVIRVWNDQCQVTFPDGRQEWVPLWTVR